MALLQRLAVAVAVVLVVAAAGGVRGQDACSECGCVKRGLRVVVVDCTNVNALTDIPDNIPNTTEQLLLVSNMINPFDPSKLQALPNLKTLRIENQPLTAFSSPIQSTSLESLVMANTQLTGIPSLAGVPNLKFLVVNKPSRRLRTLPADLLSPLATLEILEISEMVGVGAYPAGFFSGLTNLKNLTLRLMNRITAIDDTLFAGQSNLRKLLIQSHSSLRTIGNNVFSPLTNLVELDLENIPQLDLDMKPLSSLTSLQTLVLRNMARATLPEDMLYNFASLQTLKITESGLRTLPPLFFNMSDMLVTLDLEGNGLSNLDPVVFAPLGRLRALVLNGNNLNETDISLLNGENLRELSLNDNMLSQLSAGRLASLQNLELLSLNNNNLGNLDIRALNGLTNLRQLNLDGNGFLLEPGIFLGLSQVRVLSLNGCECELLALESPDLLKGLTNLDTLSLSRTKITTLEPSFFQDTPNLRVVFLQNNNLQSLPRTVFGGLTKLEELYLRENQLSELPVELFQDLGALRILELSQNGLTGLDEDLFLNNRALTDLFLDFNMITTLPPRVLTSNPSLRTLSLNNNGLMELPGGLFRGLILLTRANLANNALTILPTGVFSGLPGLEELTLSNNTGLTVIQRGAFSRIGRQTFRSVLFMDNNPSVCFFQAQTGSAFARLTCSCASQTVGDGTFCQDEDAFRCFEGTIDSNRDTVCEPCPAGTFAPFNSQATACPLCGNGTIDHDADASTPCVPCEQPGLFVPAGRSGNCSDFVCPPGFIDHDGSAATPCQAVCDVCACSPDAQLVEQVECVGLGLEHFPMGLPVTTQVLDLSDNAITALDVGELAGLTALASVGLRRNSISRVPVGLNALVSSRAIAMDLSENPSSCATVGGQLTCFCTSGFFGDGTFCDPQMQSQCLAGYVDISGNNNCILCEQAGLFVPAGSFGSCQSFLCPAGTTDADSNSATDCIPCSPGHFVPTGSTTPCAELICPGGSTDADGDPTTPCVRCGPGQFTDPAELTFGPCRQHACEAGTADADSDPSTACVPCPSGSFVQAGQAGPCAGFVCAAGTLDEDTLPTTPCVPIGPGFFIPANSSGDRVRYSCPPGTIDEDFNPATECVSCPGDRFVPGGESGSCLAERFQCPSGQADTDNDASTPCAQPSAADSRSGVSAGALAGIVIGLVALLLLILLVLNRRWKRRHAKVVKAHSFDDGAERLGLGADAKKPREIPRGNLKILDKLGAGAFGVVNKGVLNEVNATGVPSYLVAIKQFDDLNSRQRQDVYDEAFLMAQISDPNVVSLIGVVTKGDPTFIVLQFCEHGSLDHFLHETGESLLLNAKAQLAYNIACGMNTLMEHNIVHRDLAARNVLVSSDMQAKIADFGLARDMQDSEYYTSKGGQIAVRWTAPEALEGKKYSEASDVWSFGVVLWEIWTNAEKPFDGMSNTEVWLEIKAGRRLSKPTECPRHIFTIMKDCWKSAPAKRPQFSMLRHLFMQLLNGDLQALSRELRSHRVSSNTRRTVSHLRNGSTNNGSFGTLSVSSGSISPIPGAGSATLQPPPSDYVDFGISDEDHTTAPPLFVPAPAPRPSGSTLISIDEFGDDSTGTTAEGQGEEDGHTPEAEALLAGGSGKVGHSGSLGDTALGEMLRTDSANGRSPSSPSSGSPPQLRAFSRARQEERESIFSSIEDLHASAEDLRRAMSLENVEESFGTTPPTLDPTERDAPGAGAAAGAEQQAAEFLMGSSYV